MWLTKSRFNTQPPEGGWNNCSSKYAISRMFQHTAARRRLGQDISVCPASLVSTHSRPKAAGRFFDTTQFHKQVSTHSRPKAAGAASTIYICHYSCFNTQPPEGGWGYRISTHGFFPGFNTQPPEGGWRVQISNKLGNKKFQHTAARRRLDGLTQAQVAEITVSTHSRPKAAGI